LRYSVYSIMCSLSLISKEISNCCCHEDSDVPWPIGWLERNRWLSNYSFQSHSCETMTPFFAYLHVIFYYFSTWDCPQGEHFPGVYCCWMYSVLKDTFLSRPTSNFDIWLWNFQSDWLKSRCEEIIVQEIVKVPCSNAAERLHASEGVVKRRGEHRQHWSRSFRVSMAAVFLCLLDFLSITKQWSSLMRIPQNTGKRQPLLANVTIGR